MDRRIGEEDAVKSSNMGLYAVAAAIAFVGALLAGVPLGSVAPLVILLACILMMIVTMKAMHGNGSDRRARPASRVLESLIAMS